MSENVAKEIGLCGELVKKKKKQSWKHKKNLLEEEKVHRVIVLVVQLDG